MYTFNHYSNCAAFRNYPPPYGFGLDELIDPGKIIIKDIFNERKLMM